MPYIREALRPYLEPWSEDAAKDPGELNYQITVLIAEYIRVNGLKYKTINDVRGALVCAGAEFDRRIVGPYEDKKIAENGDVYQDILPTKGRGTQDVGGPGVQDGTSQEANTQGTEGGCGSNCVCRRESR